MQKDKMFASTLYQIAKIVTIETDYENKFNRPEIVEKTVEYPCRISRKNPSYPIINSSNTAINPSFRGYFEIDANINTGSVVIIDEMKYIIGLVYKPMNHHIECDLSIYTEA